MSQKKPSFVCSHVGGNKLHHRTRIAEVKKKYYYRVSVRLIPLKPEELVRVIQKITSSNVSAARKLKAIKVLVSREERKLRKLATAPITMYMHDGDLQPSKPSGGYLV